MNSAQGHLEARGNLPSFNIPRQDIEYCCAAASASANNAENAHLRTLQDEFGVPHSEATLALLVNVHTHGGNTNLPTQSVRPRDKNRRWVSSFAHCDAQRIIHTAMHNSFLNLSSPLLRHSNNQHPSPLPPYSYSIAMCNTPPISSFLHTPLRRYIAPLSSRSRIPSPTAMQKSLSSFDFCFHSDGFAPDPRPSSHQVNE